MATDIIIRASADMLDVGAIVAISAYSDAITAEFPKTLLVISGEWEDRLRVVGVEALRQIDPTAQEGQSVEAGDVRRRAIFVPGTEHLAVLYASATLQEVRNWLAQSLNHRVTQPASPNGVAIVAVLIGLTVLVFPLVQVLPQTFSPTGPLPARAFLTTALGPIIPAISLAIPLGFPVMGIAGFGTLAVFFGVWGVCALALLRLSGKSVPEPSFPGFLLGLLGAVAFAIALDRYGAAFLPKGVRFWLMVACLPSALAFCLADRILVQNARLWQRVVARLTPILALIGMMILWPVSFGIMFTLLPVMISFYVVFGSMAHALAMRSGPTTAGLVLGVCLAWSLAASLPLFEG